MKLSPQENRLHMAFLLKGFGVDVPISILHEVTYATASGVGLDDTAQQARLGPIITRFNRKMKGRLLVVPGKLKRTYRLVRIES